MDFSIDPASIPPQACVIASLLIDPSGRVRRGKSSTPLSSPEDRTRFRSLRRWADCIVIGGQTANAEPYSKIAAESRIPLVIYSRSGREVVDWQSEFADLASIHGRHLLVEAGPGLLEQLIDSEVIDRLYLTRTTRRSDDEASPKFDTSLLAESRSFELIERIEGQEDLFEIYQRKGLIEGERR